jgi:hypothetical protein
MRGLGVRGRNAYKDVLWPWLVLPKPDLRPLSVRPPAIAP